MNLTNKACKTDNLQSRILWIDAVRGIAIILVVLGHCTPPFTKLIYGFHVPLFFLISGYVWNSHGSLEFRHSIKKYFARLIKPYFMLCSINLLIAVIIGLITDNNVPIGHYVIGILYSRGTTEWMPNCSPLWYLTAAFISFVIFNLISRLNSKIFIFMMILSGLLSTSLYYFKVVKLPWNIDTALMGVVFITCGYFVKKANIFDAIKGFDLIRKVVFVTGLIAIGIPMVIYNPIDTVDFDGNRYGNVLMMFIGAISIGLTLLYTCQTAKMTGIFSRYLVFMGRNTLFIMGFDYFTGSVASVALSHYGLNNWGSIFVVKMIALSFGILIWNGIVKVIRNEKIKNILSL